MKWSKKFSLINYSGILVCLIIEMIKWTYFKISMVIYNKISAKIILKKKNLKASLSEIKHKINMASWPTFIQYCIIGSYQSNQTIKKKPKRCKSINILSLSLFGCEMKICRKNTKNIIETINKFNKITGYRTQKSTALLYASNALEEY